MKDLASHNAATQKLLWPETIQSSTADAAVLRELVPHLQTLGFDVAEFGHDTFIIHGIPAIMTDLISPQQAIEDILDRFKEGHQMMAVSYTHLDVYKRQVLPHPLISNRKLGSTALQEMLLRVHPSIQA